METPAVSEDERAQSGVKVGETIQRPEVKFGEGEGARKMCWR